jgi:heptosyltransferase-2
MKKILIIQNKRIGDVLLASVIANNMKKIFPESHISFFVYDYTAGVLENNPNVERIIRINEQKLKKIPVLIQTIWEIRRRKYDIIFDPYGKLQSRLICLFSGASVRVGLRSKKRKMRIPIYTHPVPVVEKRTSIYGRAIEDRIKMITSVFNLKSPDYEPKLFLLPEEKEYPALAGVKRPIIMLGVLGSTPQKSLPYEYIAKLINYITGKYEVTILFNYIPFQKSEADTIYEMCTDKDQIITSIYEDSIRGFIRLMNQCDMLIANEGGSVHIAKALNKPTFTVYSPYISKEHWNSFEDGKTHDSVHLLEENPDLFTNFSVEERRKIEKNPNALYLKLTPEMILRKLKPFLDHHLKS